jgi:hypothetical protein
VSVWHFNCYFQHFKRRFGGYGAASAHAKVFFSASINSLAKFPAFMPMLSGGSELAVSASFDMLTALEVLVWRDLCSFVCFRFLAVLASLFPDSTIIFIVSF